MFWPLGASGNNPDALRGTPASIFFSNLENRPLVYLARGKKGGGKNAQVFFVEEYHDRDARKGGVVNSVGEELHGFLQSILGVVLEQVEVVV